MSRPKRVLLVCPGRGSYRPNTLGYLKGRGETIDAFVQTCDEHRLQQDLPTITELDSAKKFSGRLHVAGENASLLTFTCSMADQMQLNPDYEIVGVMGNSMGFYTALAVSNALTVADTIHLIDTMAAFQKKNVIGGQVMYPITGENWQTDAVRLQSVEDAIQQTRDAGHEAYWSINLGSHAVLGADRKGLKFLLKALPELEIGSRTFPIQLPLHSAFHTPLMQETSEKALSALEGLEFSAPSIPLIDGRGHVFRPHWASPDALKAYTLTEQVYQPYQFKTSLETALHHCAPDIIAALGPGNALGGPVVRSLVQIGWRGLKSPGEFDSVQQSNPMFLSFGVTMQRAHLVK